MVKPVRTSHPDDRAALERKIESLEGKLEALRREKVELEAKVAKGPSDETWFTPGLLSLLFLGLFAALWVKYVPASPARNAPPSSAARP